MELENRIANLRVGTGKFLYGHGAVHSLSSEILMLGGRPFFIGGPTTLPLLMNNCRNELLERGIDPVCCTLDGACTRNRAHVYAEAAKENGCTVIVGVGGGKCMDQAKAVATVGEMNIITVPTSIATCAAVASVCIMYHDDGTPDGSLQMNKTPDVVIADTDLIATAPKRTLAAGIFDSIAKLPEVLHNRTVNSYKDCSLEKYICVINSQVIYDVLMGEGRKVYDLGLESGRFTDVILTNLLHTAVVSGFSCGVDQLALAHGLYDFMRRSFTQEAEGILHGEIVAVGILMQLKFNQMNPHYINEVRELMQHMKIPTKLSEIGFTTNESNIRLLLDYLIPATALTAADEPRLREAITEIC